MFTPHNVSHVTFHMSHEIFSFFFFLQRGWASRWRVCYQWGLPRLELKGGAHPAKGWNPLLYCISKDGHNSPCIYICVYLWMFQNLFDVDNREKSLNMFKTAYKQLSWKVHSLNDVFVLLFNTGKFETNSCTFGQYRES